MINLTKAHYGLLGVALLLHLILAYNAPDPNGYVYDFYSDAIVLFYESGALPRADDCWVCYHPPLLTLLGATVFHLVDWFGGDREAQLFAVAQILNLVSIIFSFYAFAIYRKYQKSAQLDLLIWGLVLFLPVCFISSFSIEPDILLATLLVIGTYYFIGYLDSRSLKNLLIASVFIGLAALTKYSGLVIVLYFGVVLMFTYLKDPSRANLKAGLTYAILTAMVGAYPYVDNWVNTGSPIVGNKAWSSKKNFADNYDFHSFSIRSIVDVFTNKEEVKLKHYKAYNSEVWNSHYGQIWTDFSFFTKPHRHGQWELYDIYPGKHMPTWLLWSLLVFGLVPVIAGIFGLGALLISRECYLLIGMAAIMLAVYIDWVFGNPWWMLKTKYHMQLLPLWLVSIDKAATVIPYRYLMFMIAPSVVLAAVYCFYFAFY